MAAFTKNRRTKRRRFIPVRHTRPQNSTKARRQLGWQHRVSFDQLVEQMVKQDLKLAKQWAAASLKREESVGPGHMKLSSAYARPQNGFRF